MKKELICVLMTGKHHYAYRQSNQTILFPKSKASDSDRLIIEDKRGHRYARNSIGLEGNEYYIMNII